MAQAIRQFEDRLREMSRFGKTYAEQFCGGQFLLVRSCNGFEVVGDGLVDEGEFVYKVFRLNIFGRLVERHCYTYSVL